MPKSSSSWHRASFIVILVCAVVALGAAVTLTIEKMHLMRDPDATLSCSFSLIMNCAGVMNTWQASLAPGFPNMFIGLMAFPVIITVAVAALWGGARFNRGFMLAMNAGVLLGAIFSYWLFFNSLYVIEVLCPWCLIVTATCTLLFAATVHITLKENYLRFSHKTNKAIQTFLEKGFHQLVVASWIVLMIVLVYLKFGTALFA